MRILLLPLCLSLAVAADAAAPIDLYIICNSDGSNPVMSGADFSAMLPTINAYYAQVGMSFYLRSQHTIASNAWRTIEYGGEAADELRRKIPATGGVKMFAVENVVNGAQAFCGDYGIIFTPQCSANTIAHELGHACGLDDIYIQKTFMKAANEEETVAVDGLASSEWMPLDWGRYEKGVLHSALIEKLLMYGAASGTECDLTAGDVYGVGMSVVTNEITGSVSYPYELKMVPVGFWLHGDRSPQSL